MTFKNVGEIKTAVAAGKHVCWRNVGYRVVVDNAGGILIKCDWNGHMIGLTDKAGDLADFFIRHMCVECEKNSVPEPGDICWECALIDLELEA